MKIFSDNSEEGEKRDIAFQAISAMRDTMSIARRKPQHITYEQSLRIYADLDPEIYEEFDKLVSEKNQNERSRLFIEQAQVLTETTGKTVTPDELVEKEIKKYKELKKNAKKGQTRRISQEISALEAVLENLKPRYLSEHAIIVNDFTQIDRTKLFGEKTFAAVKHVEYSLSKERLIRIRLLHPDKPEHLTGADLVYEQIDTINERVRFLFMQYKTWDDNVIYFSSHRNLLPQLQKMEKLLCKHSNKYCEFRSSTSLDNFRMPYCSGFLRPTDKLQFKKSKMISSGMHLPVCAALEIYKTQKKFEKDFLKNVLPDHYIFERLFALGLVGSRWIDYEEAEVLYQKNGILDEGQNLTIHAREFVREEEPEDDFGFEEDR